MKTNRIFKYLASALLLTGMLSSCSDDKTGVGSPELEGCQGVYFPSQTSVAKDHELDPTAATKLTFTIMRTNDTDAVTVPVSVKCSEEGIFAADDAVFAEGQTETTIDVNFPTAEVGVTYKCEVFVSGDQYVLKYGNKAAYAAFSVTRVKWNKLLGEDGETTGKWREDLLTTWFTVDNLECEVEIYERDDKPGYYRIPNVYSAQFMGDLFEDTAEEMAPWRYDANIIIDATNKEKVFMPLQYIGVNLGYGEIRIGSRISKYFTGVTEDVYGTLTEGGVITFPKDGILLSMANHKNGGWYTSNNNGMLRIMLPGAIDYDYSFKATASEPANGKVNIDVALGADLTKIKYAFFEGVANSTAAKSYSGKITSGSVASEELTASTTLEVELPATGKYTMVANLYDADGEFKSFEYISFGYVTAEDTRPVVLSYGLIVSDKYKPDGYTAEDSVEAYFSGKNIEAGFYGLYETEALETLTTDAALIAKVKTATELTAADLKKVNGDGYAEIIGGLNGGTEHTLLVYAYNGYYWKLFKASATTEGLAHPLKRTYTAADITDIVPKAELFKTWNMWAKPITGSGAGVVAAKRTKLATVTFSENTTNDSEGCDAINVSGLSLGVVPGDTNYWEWYNGVIYQLKAQLWGTWQAYYVAPRYADTAGMGAHTLDYMMAGAYIADGYIAMVSNDEDYDFKVIQVFAFSNAALTTTAGYISRYSDIVFEDPTKAIPMSASMAEEAAVQTQQLHKLSKDMNVDNYVELRGRERIHALIDEMRNTPGSKAVNLATSSMKVEMPELGAVKANVSTGVKAIRTVDFKSLKKGNVVKTEVLE